MTQLPQHMTFAVFGAAATCEKLFHHGRDWEVFLDGKSLGFADGTMEQALRQAHENAVNNALYVNSEDGPSWMAAPLPTAEVLREYPLLTEKFPGVSRSILGEEMHGEGYDGLHTFADVRAMVDKVASHKALGALNDAVQERFMRDQQQLTMTDGDWTEWTALIAHKAGELERMQAAHEAERTGELDNVQRTVQTYRDSRPIDHYDHDRRLKEIQAETKDLVGELRTLKARGAVSAFLEANRDAYAAVSVDTAKGDYCGPFIFVNEHYAVQALGRGGVAVHEEVRTWATKPALGQHGAVRYRDGTPSVVLKAHGREQRKGNGLARD